MYVSPIISCSTLFRYQSELLFIASRSIVFLGTQVKRGNINTNAHMVLLCSLQVDYMAVLEALQNIPGVEDVHDLHIWSISSQATSLTCHIMVRTGTRTALQMIIILL
jgi:Co/Zn/Cd efflux system component